MTQQELINLYTALQESEKARFLVIVGYELTIAVRGGAYDETISVDTRLKKFTGANELQHHLNTEARHHLEQENKRYSDDALINILLEKAAHYDLREELGTSLIRSMKWFQK